MGAVDVTESKVLKEGFEYDRRWMLINTKGEFISQRNFPELARFGCQLETRGLQVSYNNKDIQIPYELSSDARTKVDIWNVAADAWVVSPELNRWFSEQLNQKVTLVKMTQASNRIKKFLKPPFSSSVSFADGYPYLMLGEESMRYLNEKLENEILIDRFRANIIVKTKEPHEEDNWGKIKIGDSILKVIKPCARCVVTTIDQQTSQKGKEPLKTLASYRKKGNKIYFGANAIAIEEGFIKKGDSILNI